MSLLAPSLNQPATIALRTTTLLQEELEANRRRTDRMFAWLMASQWLTGIAAAFWISPRLFRWRWSPVVPLARGPTARPC